MPWPASTAMYSDVEEARGCGNRDRAREGGPRWGWGWGRVALAFEKPRREMRAFVAEVEQARARGGEARGDGNGKGKAGRVGEEGRPSGMGSSARAKAKRRYR